VVEGGERTGLREIFGEERNSEDIRRKDDELTTQVKNFKN